MKTVFLSRILVLFLFSITFVSCNDDDSNKWYDSMPDGGPFHTDNGLRFFYVDDDGNDLINPKDFSTLPVSSLEELDSQPVIKSIYKDFLYNDQYNSVVYNEDKGLYEFFTYAFGDSKHSDYTFYVYYKGIADKMDVKFQYQDLKVNNGLFYVSNIISWSVNNVEVYNLKNPAMRKYIYLVKKSDGTTSIVFDEEN